MTRSYIINKTIIILIHDNYIGSLELDGILNEGSLDYLVDNIDIETDIFKKAAWGLYLAKIHPFWDGQKRTAWYVADLILRDGGYYIHAERGEIIDVLKKIADSENYNCDLEDIETWVRKRARRIFKYRQLRLSQFL